MRLFMKKSFLLAGCFAASLTLFACGDSSSDASNVDIEDDSCSSEAVESSSSGKIVASSAAASGERAATLADLGAHKNKYLDDLFGTKVFIASGSQKGLISLWLPRKEITSVDSAWVVVQSEFKDGVLEISSNNSAMLGVSDDKGAGASMMEMTTKGAKLKFIVNKDGKLQYSLNGGDYKAVVDTTVNMTSNIVTDGDKLKNKRYECEHSGAADTTLYSFYDGRYIAENVVDGKVVSWVAGYSDIQKGRLLIMNPEVFKVPDGSSTMDISRLRTASVSADNKLTFVTGEVENCKVSDIKVASVDVKKLASSWIGSLDEVYWTMTLRNDGSFSLENGSSMWSGSWLLYGDELLMHNKRTSMYRGKVSNFDATKGFTYNLPAATKLPNEWKVPVSE